MVADITQNKIHFCKTVRRCFFFLPIYVYAAYISVFSLVKLGEAIEKLPFKGDASLENIIKNTVYLGLPDRIDLLGKPKNKKQEKLYGGKHDRSL